MGIFDKMIPPNNDELLKLKVSPTSGAKRPSDASLRQHPFMWKFWGKPKMRTSNANR